MDKELPKSKMTVKPGKLFVKLSKSQLPGQEPFFRGTLPNHPSLTLDDIAERAVRNRSSYSHGTLIASFNTMLEEIYGAIEDGFNVDFGLGRTELTVGGRFKTEFEKFDRERHAIRINLRPSPRLNQLADWFPAEVIQFFPNAPLPNEVSIHNDRYLNQEGREFCVIPAGYTLPLFIHGKRLKVMGDHPDVGIVIRQEEGEIKYFIEPRMVFINESPSLAFLPPEPLTPGWWVIEVWSQYNACYRLYKEPRMGMVTLTVSATTASGCGD